MKRIKMNRRDFIKNSAFITGAAAGASLLVGRGRRSPLGVRETVVEPDKTDTALAGQAWLGSGRCGGGPCSCFSEKDAGVVGGSPDTPEVSN